MVWRRAGGGLWLWGGGLQTVGGGRGSERLTQGMLGVVGKGGRLRGTRGIGLEAVFKVLQSIKWGSTPL